MEKINFQNGTLISKAKVTINNMVYEVEPAEYEGTTPLSANILNQMQTNIENAIENITPKVTVLASNIQSQTESEVTLSDNINNYDLFILQVNNYANENFILASTTVTKEELKNSTSNYTIGTQFAIEPDKYTVYCYYSTDTKVFFRTTSNFDRAKLIGIKL